MHGWLKPGDHIAVALSGDPKSIALLFFFKKLTGNRRDIRLSVITIDPGIAGFPLREPAQKAAAACGVEWYCGSFADRYGITLDAIVQREGTGAACLTCRVLRGDLLGEIAEARGVTRCAYATTLDDRAGAFFSGMLNGTVRQAFASSSLSGTTGKVRVPCIHPFMEIPAPEVIRYAELCPEYAGPAAPVLMPVCPYSSCDPVKDEQRTALDAFDQRHPATKFALANLARTLSCIHQDIPAGEPAACPVCGGVLELGKCPACAIRRKFRKETVS